MTAVDVLIIIAKALFVVAFSLGLVPVLVWLERKGSAIIQDRIGPNRAAIGFVRLGGLVHLVADAIKLFFKEDITPTKANKFYFYLAPFIAAAVGLMTFAVIPFADTLILGDKIIRMQVLNIDAGVLWFLAIVSLSVYGIVFAGWASNSKFPLLGALRAASQMLSYEIPLGLSLISLLMVFGTLQLNDIVRQQGELLWGFIPMWGIFIQPLAAIIFIVCSFAETNRHPFDLVEGESEIVGGFHTEYSSMKFGMFFMAEYVAMVVSAALITTLLLGGWQIPFLATGDLIDNYLIVMQISFGLLSLLSFFIAWRLYIYYQDHRNRWGDIKDYEGLIFSILAVIVGIILIGVLVLVSIISLPAWFAPVFAFLAQLGMFILKVFFVCWVFVWVRWTLPRFRYDQLMDLGWRSLLPLSLLNIFITGAVILLLE